MTTDSTTHRNRKPPLGVTPTDSTPRWLVAVARCDRALSSWFIGAGFFFAPILLILDPWPSAVAVAWIAISLSGLWLGLLGAFMAAGLARVLRAGEVIPDEFWIGLLDYRQP
ncbi:hypothetical protein RD149_05920 [Gordonia westfalica]|uniref:Uncharacterized protein n=1 Tax=Gordonia westfalica TaxID=158898 RepID=A0A1H2KVZ7_9ACTN|nr:hypothetical protein [Gordonia westfalica]MDS1113299.1 hypothetical protein [Gordonia westfalica]SDU72712.1 hypothetical protein SAMN04488548_1343817 [Gordonia westfalica]